MLQKNLSKTLENMFYMNVHKAQASDIFSFTVGISKLFMGGSPHLWRLLDREILRHFKRGAYSESQIDELIESCRTA